MRSQLKLLPGPNRSMHWSSSRGPSHPFPATRPDIPLPTAPGTHLAQRKHALNLIGQRHHVARRIPRPGHLCLCAQSACLGSHHGSLVVNS